MKLASRKTAAKRCISESGIMSGISESGAGMSG